GGIGRALVRLLVTEGWRVLAVARQPEGLEEDTPLVYEADVRREASVTQAVYSAAQDVDAVDLWIYAAGDIASARVEEMAADAWHNILAANLSGAYLAVHHSLPLLAPDAHMVFLGAVSERLQLPGLAAYAAAKAGLEAFAAALGKEERRRRVTVVRPGAVATSLWDKVPMKLPADAPPPEKVARRILDAVESGHKGTLDLV
ncbi:MAG: SDR family NAD(P)-dependent oxidoreductase, partial [Anaerolineae bacterium]|nr:SDR family NAD(P)-dependent oxidoreductase [Anaerolineae bacterium]